MGSNEVMKSIKCLLPIVCLFSSYAMSDTLLVPKQYKTVQSAIDAAVKGDQILIAPGTYNESLVMPSIGIEVIGMKGPDVTTIDATGLDGSVVLCYIDPKDQDPHSDDSITGLSLTGGTGTEHPVWETHLGGCIFILNTSPTISNCIVYGNTAEFGAGGFWVQDSHSQISNVYFEDNHVYKFSRGGGAFYLWNSTATVTGCTFVNNSSDSGGALKCKGSDSSVISGCTFNSNHANDHGGAIATTNSTSIFDGCNFTGNTADFMGGAASIDNGDAGIVFSNCTFYENAAVISGGALRIHQTGAVVEKCVFIGNSGPYGGGGIVVNGITSPGVCTVSGSTFQDNDGGSNGGGIHNTNISSSDVDTSTFCGNVAVPITGNWNDLGGNSMSASCSFFCGGDIDANGVVNVEDILRLLSEWGPCDGVTSCFSDQTEDGVVDVSDLLMLIANWGTCG